MSVRYPVVIDCDVYVFNYESYIFDQPFTCFQPKDIFDGNSKLYKMTKFSGGDSSDFDGKTILLECENNEYIYFWN